MHDLNESDILFPFTVRAYYKGQFKNSKPDGIGTLFFVNGEHIEGHFMAGSAHGMGRFYDKEGVYTSG